MFFISFLVVFGVLALIVFSARATRPKPAIPPNPYGNVIFARGLILKADRTSSDVTYRGQRFEARDVVLDIEVPGQAPYERSFTARFPRICEALPGATLDLQIDPTDPSEITVIGPAGSRQWLPAASVIPGQMWTPPYPGIGGASASSGSVGLVFLLLGVSLAGAGVISAVFSAAANSHDTSAGETPEPRPTHEPPTHETPTPTKPEATAVRHGSHPQCDAVVRCCEAIPLKSCAAFRSDTEEVCAAALPALKTAAVKVGKRCP